MDDKRIVGGDLLWSVLGTIILFAMMIASAIAWVAFYSHALDPGHDAAFYEAYAAQASPIVSVVAGGPVFFLVARWLGRRRGSSRAPWFSTALYLLIDAALLAAVGAFASSIAFAFAGGAVLKIAGTALAVRRRHG